MIIQGNVEGMNWLAFVVALAIAGVGYYLAWWGSAWNARFVVGLVLLVAGLGAAIGFLTS